MDPFETKADRERRRKQHIVTNVLEPLVALLVRKVPDFDPAWSDEQKSEWRELWDIAAQRAIDLEFVKAKYDLD